MGSDPAEKTATARIVDSGATFETWELKSTSMTLRWKGRGVLEIVLRGHGYEELAAIAIRRKEAVLAEAGELAVFFDLGNMPGYDSGLRVALTRWLQSHLKAVKVHVIVRSKIVAMGVSVANLALGGIIQTYTQRVGAFERALESAVERTAP